MRGARGRGPVDDNARADGVFEMDGRVRAPPPPLAGAPPGPVQPRRRFSSPSPRGATEGPSRYPSRRTNPPRSPFARSSTVPTASPRRRRRSRPRTPDLASSASPDSTRLISTPRFSSRFATTARCRCTRRNPRRRRASPPRTCNRNNWRERRSARPRPRGGGCEASSRSRGTPVGVGVGVRRRAEISLGLFRTDHVRHVRGALRR